MSESTPFQQAIDRAKKRQPRGLVCFGCKRRDPPKIAVICLHLHDLYCTTLGELGDVYHGAIGGEGEDTPGAWCAACEADGAIEETRIACDACCDLIVFWATQAHECSEIPDLPKKKAQDVATPAPPSG